MAVTEDVRATGEGTGEATAKTEKTEEDMVVMKEGVMATGEATAKAENGQIKQL